MTLMPLPSAAHDTLQLRMSRLPPKLALDFFRTRHQHGGVPWTTRSFLRRNRMAGHFPRALDYFADAESASIPQVVDQSFFLFQSSKREQVCDREIRDVYVIAD